MQKELEAAHRYQAELLDLITKLADKIAVPATVRNGAEIRADWAQIAMHRRRLSSTYRQLAKFKPRPRQSLNHAESHAQKKLLKEKSALKQRLAVWDIMADMVERHANPPKHAINLVPEPTARDALVTELASALHKLANAHVQTETAKDHGCFADIPLPLQGFEELTRAAYRVLLAQGRTKGVRFLDVGCGGGTKMFLATKFFDQCDGLEYDPAYVRAGQETLRVIAPDCHIMEADALQFEGYSDYDVIYFYRPLSEDDKLVEMERHILSQCRPGTIILAPYTATLDPRPGFPAAQIDACVFVAGLSQQDVDALRKDATYTATEPVKRASDFPFDVGFWAPLLSAASLNVPR